MEKEYPKEPRTLGPGIPNPMDKGQTRHGPKKPPSHCPLRPSKRPRNIPPTNPGPRHTKPHGQWKNQARAQKTQPIT